MRPTTRLKRGLAFAAVAGLLPGCLWRTEPICVDAPAPTQVASLTSPECPRDGAGLGGERVETGEGVIPVGFAAVAVLQCLSEGVGSDGRLSIEERRSLVTDDVLEALRLPDRVLTTHGNPPVACSVIDALPSLLMLLDESGRGVVVRQPREPCGYPRREVVDAVRALRVDKVTTYTVQIRP